MTPNLFDANLALLTARFPGQVTLSYDDVAACLGYTGNNAYQWVRSSIERGDVMPGLTKCGGRYFIPLTTFAEWLASLQGEPKSPPRGKDPLPLPRPTRRRGRNRNDDEWPTMEQVRQLTEELKRKHPTGDNRSP